MVVSSSPTNAGPWARGHYAVTTAPGAVDIDVVHELLSTSYWAAGRSRDAVRKTVEHSLCFSVLHNDSQVGFARAVTDATVFAWIADLIIHPDHRGNGLGIWLMECITNHPTLAPCTLLLRTRDAHRLYEKFGFSAMDTLARRRASDNP